MVKVQLHVYDISQGIAATLSEQFLGQKVDGVWHTGVVVFGYEYFYGGGGIQKLPPAAITASFGIRPVRTVDLGNTEIDEPAFQAHLNSIAHKYTESSYDLLKHNCNNFSDEAAKFLTGSGIPEYIVNLPNIVLNSPMGQQFAAMLRPLDARLQSSMHAPAGSAPAAAPKSSETTEQSKPAQEVLFKVTVKISGGQLESHVLEFAEADPDVGKVKQAISDKSGYRIEDMRIIHGGALLNKNDKKMSECGIKNENTIHMSPKSGAVKMGSGGTTKAESTASVDTLLAQIETCAAKEKTVALKTLSKVLTNIINNPNDAKYRKIKLANLQKRLNPVPGSLELLRAIGFVEQTEDAEVFLVLEANEQRWNDVVSANNKVTAKLKPPSTGAPGAMPRAAPQFPGGIPGVGGPGGLGNFMRNAYANQTPAIDERVRAQMLQNPEFIRSMINSPMMQQLVQGNPALQSTVQQMADNPQLLQTMLQSPMFQQMQQEMQNNPESVRNMMNMFNNANMGNPNIPTPNNTTMPPLFPPQMFNPGAYTNNTTSNTSGGNSNSTTPGAGNGNSTTNANQNANDGQMTEEEMLQEAIRRSLQEQ